MSQKGYADLVGSSDVNLALGPVHPHRGIFENASFFIRFRLASTRRRRFRSPKTKLSKSLSSVDLFENVLCVRVKTELSKDADATASIYYATEHAHESLRIMRGHFACLFSFIEVRNLCLYVAVSLCEQGYFGKCSSCGRGYFFKRIKKDTFSTISGYVWTRPRSMTNYFVIVPR